MILQDPEKLKFWKSHILKYKAGALPAKKYCDKNNITYSQLKYWIRRINRINALEQELAEQAGTNQPFVELKADESKAIKTISHSTHMDLYLNDSMKIRLTKDFDPQLLSKVLQVAGDIL